MLSTTASIGSEVWLAGCCPGFRGPSCGWCSTCLRKSCTHERAKWPRKRPRLRPAPGTQLRDLLVEAVRQLRGESEERQVPDAKLVVIGGDEESLREQLAAMGWTPFVQLWTANAWRANGFSHYVAKHVNSRYHPGEVAEDWLEVSTSERRGPSPMGRLVGARPKKVARIHDERSEDHD